MKANTYVGEAVREFKRGTLTTTEIVIELTKDVQRLADKVQELEKQLHIKKEKGL